MSRKVLAMPPGGPASEFDEQELLGAYLRRERGITDDWSVRGVDDHNWCPIRVALGIDHTGHTPHGEVPTASTDRDRASNILKDYVDEHVRESISQKKSLSRDALGEAIDELQKETRLYTTRRLGPEPKVTEGSHSVVLTIGIWIVFLFCFTAFGEHAVTQSTPFQIAIPLIGLGHYFIPRFSHKRWMKTYQEYYSPRWKVLMETS